MDQFILASSTQTSTPSAGVPASVIQINIGPLESAIAGIVFLVGLGISWATLKTTVQGLKQSLDELKSDVRELRSGLSVHGEALAVLKTKYGTANSPMAVNEAGKKLLEDSKFNQIYPRLQPKIFQLLDTWNTRTLYDVENNALKALNEIKDDALIDPLKDYAVNHPGEPLELIFTVASWLIRDDYWQQKKTRPV